MADNSNKITTEDRGIQRARARNRPTNDSPLHFDTESRTCCHTMGGRNLIVCIDGDPNPFGEKNTNLVELYNLILKGVENNQKAWYNSGIGSFVRPGPSSPWKSVLKDLYHTIDLAIAWDFDQTILAAYRWLSDNYEPGDCIFLFGFSRGAYQVRVLSAMIDKVGLVYKENELQIPFAFELYADPKSDIEIVTQVGSLQEERKMSSSADRFKRAFSHKDVKVHFVGAWDTIWLTGITGITLKAWRVLPRTTDGMRHVCYFRHALALDERRVKFLPEYAYGGSSKPPGTIANPMTKFPHTLEVWFAGTHFDIGGGNVGMDSSRPPLRWMVFEAGALGVRMERFDRKPSSIEEIYIRETLIRAWWLPEILPLKRLTHTRREQGNPVTRKPHFGSHRKIHNGQKIHSSVFKLLASTLNGGRPYIPKARLPGDNTSVWEMARREMLGQWLEVDLYEDIDNLVKRFVEEQDNVSLQNLHQIALRTLNGRQAVCESLYKGVTGVLKDLASSDDSTRKKLELLRSTADILKESSRELKQAYSAEIRHLVLDLSTSDNTDYRQMVRKFLAQCTDSCVHVLHEHTGYVNSVAFSPDGKHVVSGSNDKTVRIWDLERGKQLGQPFQGHTYSVNCVAFSPDGNHVVSGSDDRTIRIWDLESGKQVTKLQEQMHRFQVGVNSVAFLPDGKNIVFSSDDGTVLIWDSETGNQVREPFQRHKHFINSITFSHDGKHAVSGTADGTIWVWGLEESETQVGESLQLQGHTDYVRAAAFSPDGKHIASGSDDRTVRIWDLETGKQVGEAFQGHTHLVTSVAFSPDGKYVVSGSVDKTAQIWDLGTGDQVREPFHGHKHWVTSVAFSPDGKHIVSGSADNTVQIWYANT